MTSVGARRFADEVARCDERGMVVCCSQPRPGKAEGERAGDGVSNVCGARRPRWSVWSGDLPRLYGQDVCLAGKPLKDPRIVEWRQRTATKVSCPPRSPITQGELADHGNTGSASASVSLSGCAVYVRRGSLLPAHLRRIAWQGADNSGTTVVIVNSL